MTQEEVTKSIQDVSEAIKRVEDSLQIEHRKATVFVAVGRVIMLGKYCVGRMKSNTYAIRTANALNKHVPNERGV